MMEENIKVEEKTAIVEPTNDSRNDLDLITQANMAAERLERANSEQRKLLEKQERLLSESRLQGKSFGGRIEEKPKIESDEDYALRFLKEGFNPLR